MLENVTMQTTQQFSDFSLLPKEPVKCSTCVVNQKIETVHVGGCPWICQPVRLLFYCGTDPLDAPDWWVTDCIILCLFEQFIPYSLLLQELDIKNLRELEVNIHITLTIHR